MPRVGKGSGPVPPPSPRTQKLKAQDTPKEKVKEEKKLTKEEVKGIEISKKRSAAFSEAAVKQALQAKQPKYSHGTDYTGEKNPGHGPYPLPRSYEGKESYQVRDRLNSLLSGFMGAASSTRHYHATRTRNLEGDSGILKKGLQPRFGGTGAATGSEQFEEQSKGKVHLGTREVTATKYKEFFQTGKMGKKTTEPSEAEVLRVNLSKKQVDKLQRDPDDTGGKTLQESIDPKYIRRETDAPPGQLKLDEHLAKGKAEREALLSNLKPEFKQLFDEEFPEPKTGDKFFKEKMEQRDTALQMLRQGVIANNPKLLR